MFRYLLDTDHITLLFQAVSRDQSLVFKRYSDNHGITAVSVVSYHEQLIGAHAAPNKCKTARQLIPAYRIVTNQLANYQKMPMLEFREAEADQLEELKSLNLRVARMDLRIAAIALANDLTLVTRNRSDFERIPDLGLEDWTK